MTELLVLAMLLTGCAPGDAIPPAEEPQGGATVTGTFTTESLIQDVIEDPAFAGYGRPGH